MKKLGWVLVIAWWLYFVAGLVLYLHFGFKWVNTVDVLLTFTLLVAFSVWYVVQKFQSGSAKSRWVLGWNGALYRRKGADCSIKQPK